MGFEYAQVRSWLARLGPVPSNELPGSCCAPATPNSTGQPATISASGSPVAVFNYVFLRATELPPNQFGYFLNSRMQGLVANPPGSQGTLFSRTMREFAKLPVK